MCVADPAVRVVWCGVQGERCWAYIGWKYMSLLQLRVSKLGVPMRPLGLIQAAAADGTQKVS